MDNFSARWLEGKVGSFIRGNLSSDITGLHFIGASTLANKTLRIESVASAISNVNGLFANRSENASELASSE